MTKQHASRVTRDDVAREAGTSVAVVSYVINNGPRPVAKATRQRVLDAIKSTGYRPNGVAQALASGKTRTYGLVVPNISNTFIASFAHALQQEALDNGLVILLGDSGDCRKRELNLINSLLSQRVDGLFYTSVDRHPHIDLIQASGTPFVMLDRVDPRLAVNMLRVDERAAARQVTAHLLSHGYREVGMIAGPLDMLNAQDRLNGWRDALTESGIEERPEWIFPASYTRQGGYEATQRMLVDGRPPRAVFCSNEAQAIGCIRALSEHGLNVPEQMALVCFNGTEESAYYAPSLTTVCQPVREMAKAAIAMLLAWDGEVKLQEFSHRLVVGESCGCTVVKTPQA
ncbi:LacI family DNA-binding transcriptional regulator [Pseudomonas gingeri]|uniref:LacI family DNA-binding transcriptional regulator n=1 Tax=Pseudomonas gingeri TaxID=117681 RepID=UPI0015A00C71|nr:LacI family DNA-binding transcriptional regulator [Pseudomonas gingeri]NWA02374.1 LacI family DNA-binding transcriptional regulator [Pseudomonas gingeri]NWA12453.1 LacI family DNA-binding transcriptional regulator [Pseudomonas gingeri]NWA57141.1 LacI family DNA-binding transcriptional regulator [Pseudomonas gingeri]NWA93484.1 LacI family DNA-binding transcriptional regulator [Pseudomonas gingeri]NWB02956.1 LacI family DNA-binding transcriptional regulator [Pseudomonas gingeri]